MAHLDSLLDDALLCFDDDEADAPAAPAPAPPAQQTATTGPKELAAAAAQPGGTAAPDAAAGTSPAASGGSAAAGTRAAGGSLQFDPLKRKKKPGKAGAGAAAPAPAAAAAARDALGSSSSTGSGGSRRPALTPQVHQLQEDLAKLMADWSQALHPEADDMSGQEQQQQQQRASSSVLQALAAQTQRTVDEQARLQPPLPGSLASAAAAAAAGAARPGAGGAGEGGEQQQVNAIVDVVMQHLLSKDVLYQPMKEIKDKYPPWLERHAAQGAASSLPAGELQRYQQQYAIICTLVQAYDSEPDNTAKIMDLLQQMQACGEPPAEIVEEMSSAIAADLPGLAGASAAGAGGGPPDLDFDNLDIGDLGLENLPAELKNCPVQ